MNGTEWTAPQEGAPLVDIFHACVSGWLRAGPDLKPRFAEAVSALRDMGGNDPAVWNKSANLALTSAALQPYDLDRILSAALHV